MRLSVWVRVSEDALLLGERLVRLSVYVFMKRAFKIFLNKTRVYKIQVLFKF